MEIKTQKPWLTKKGNEFPTEQLQEISRSWDQSTWDQYLSWYSSKSREEEIQSEPDIKKPWLDSEGQLLNRLELKKVTKKWDAETWDQYLTATVDQDFHESEVLFEDYETLLEETGLEIQVESKPFPNDLKNQVRKAVRALAPVQKKVVIGLFYEGYSQVKVGRRLGISQPTVHEIKIISLNKIKRLLDLDPIPSSYLIGGHKNSDPQNQTQQEQIREVYLADLKGSYIK